MTDKTAAFTKGKPEEALLCIDKGGTFTDCLYQPGGSSGTMLKILSSGEYRFSCNARRGQNVLFASLDSTIRPESLPGMKIRLFGDQNEFTCRVMASDAESNTLTLEKEIPFEPHSAGLFTGEESPVLAARLLTGTPPDTTLPKLQWRLAGTQTTNALLEGTFAPAALIVSEGFKDLLLIGSQQRPDLFSLKVNKPAPIYARVQEAGGILTTEGNEQKPLNADLILASFDDWKKSGIEVAAVCLRNAWKNPAHEQHLRKLLNRAGFEHVILSSDTARLINYHDRSQTTLVNAVLNPVLRNWRADLERAAPEGTKLVMSSAGGLKPFGGFQPVDSLLSGPAAGVAGAAASGREAGFSRILSFDMGGTSTDVARIDGDPQLTFSHRVGQVSVMAPAVDIETVAAGGGSICRFDGHRLRVGPESAGADPGPAAYGKGGPFTLTDLNLISGRILPELFSIPVDFRASEKAFEKLRDEIREKTGSRTEAHRLTADLFDIANERMADAIRTVSVRRGFSPDAYALLSFGGAGGQHACDIAERLRIQTIQFPATASVLSAYGLMTSEVEEIAEKQLLQPLDEVLAEADEIVASLKKELRRKTERITKANPEFRTLLLMRLRGQETTLQVDCRNNDLSDAPERFRSSYRRIYGILPAGDAVVEVESMRMIASVKPAQESGKRTFETEKLENGPVKSQSVVLSDALQEVPCYRAGNPELEHGLKGPALIGSSSTTVFLKPGWRVIRHPSGSLIAGRTDTKENDAQQESGRLKPAQLELSGNRLQGIANEMGEVLRSTAVSVNIKERLDYSCAVFDAKGFLVANAAHIPVHLGALGLCVRAVMKEQEMKPGAVYVTNHPAYGGSHLPDVTVISPCFAGDQLMALVASRAHHAEIGGIRPGSMSPDARHLGEEGCVISPINIVRTGRADMLEVERLLRSGPYPSRNVKENLADIESAVAANQRGISRLLEWADESGAEGLTSSMNMILDYGEQRALETISKLSEDKYEAEEQLDDGTVLKACITLENKKLKVDFNGTSGVHKGNLNATPAIVNSVVMYVMRLLVDEPVPLNEGLLRAVDIVIPQGMLRPDFSSEPEKCPAVFGGNTEVSQRLTDTLIKALGMAACSQGTMNNVLFGNERFGFYETIGGGTGAGPGFDGADAVHHHMTNTRITDVEVMEHRYPVRVNRFEIRKGSGGEGRYKGGCGVRRELEFAESVSLTLMGEHRRVKPFGMDGGEPGAPARQRIIRKNGQEEELPGQAKAELKAGDRFIIETPGGGGFGRPSKNE